jgi:hypothetical protein
MENIYQLLADLVLMVHLLFVVFVGLALLLTVVGGYRQWPWIHNWWFRTVHLACIVFVVGQSWLGMICPLTSLEMWLRSRAHVDQYDGGFIQFWLTRILYYTAPDWVFGLIYTAFGLLVAIAWLRFPPDKKTRSR